MKIFLPGSRGRHRMYVQPGKEFPTSDFVGADGIATQFAVEFVNGCAEVPDNLGRYMLDKDMAKSSPIILPIGLVV